MQQGDSTTEGQRSKPQAYVAFYANGQIIEMVNLDQFEDILEGMHPVPGRSKRFGRALYFNTNPRGAIVTLVFFKVPVDTLGNCLEGWRLPLQRLAETAVLGPDLGNGRVTLACFSQCPISWHRDSLWDPTKEDLKALVEAYNGELGENAKMRHHLLTTSEEDLAPKQAKVFEASKSPKPSAQGSAESQSSVSQPAKPKAASSQASQLSTSSPSPASSQTKDSTQKKASPMDIGLPDDMLVGLDDDDLEDEDFEQDLERLMRNERQGYRNQIQELQQEVERQRTLNDRMQRRLLESGIGQDKAEAEDSGQLNAKIQEMDVRMKQLVTQMETLEEENQQLQQENDELVEINTGAATAGNGSQDVLSQMKAQGLVSMVYHSGAGHVSIAADELLNYLRDPLEFVAQSLGLNKVHYEHWLHHDQEGRCTQCGAPIDHEADPKAFVPGFTDCCDNHRN